VDALVRMEEVKRGRDASVRKRWRERAYALECAQKEAQIRRATGGRLGSDPRQEWRYGKAGVSSITVMMMLHGFPDAPNRAERMVAIIRLESQRVRDERTSRMRPLFDSEIADRLLRRHRDALARRAQATPGPADTAPSGRCAVAGRAPCAWCGTAPTALITNLTARL
jgi:hypothetical protein